MLENSPRRTLNTIFALLLTVGLLGGGALRAAHGQEVARGSHDIIPLPVSVERLDFTVTIDDAAAVAAAPSFRRAAEVVREGVRSVSGLELPLGGPGDDVDGTRIAIVPDDAIGPEAYRITMAPDAITIHAGSAAGAFYGAQTLRQVMWTADAANGSIALPAANVEDAPQYAWRGFHLDVSRHFFTKEYLMEVIDWMALYKKNKFHLHLTDDQGWRIQIDEYPLLTDIGAWRTFNAYDSTVIERSATNPMYELDPRFVVERDGSTLYGGFYTKQDIQDIVRHAQSNFVDVIPEIDMPGHMSAAIRAYPELSCTGGEGWGEEFSHPMCPCKEGVTEFALNVWDDVMEQFPSDTVHIGADEVEKGTWESSADCQAFMAEHDLEDVEAIQNHFVRELQAHLESRGKTVVAWDDVIDGNVDENLMIMYWRDYQPDSPTRTAANGNSIIMTPWSWFYLSFRHTDDRFRDLYDFDPAAELEPQVIDFVHGYQSSVWTETIPSEEAFEYFVFPRFQASAEIGWSTDRRNWDSFVSRLATHLRFMDEREVNYRQPGFMP